MDLPEDTITDLIRRLRRVEGQVRGIQQMLTEGRDCREVVTQLSAANKALEQAGFVLVAAGLTWCLEDPERSAAEGAGWWAVIASRVALGAGSLAPSAPRIVAASSALVAPRGTTSPSEIAPVVIVPVLSRQRVSTRASSSTDASSLASAWRRARAITPVMKLRLVSSTSPSGTIATAAATVLWSASCQGRSSSLS